MVFSMPKLKRIFATVIAVNFLVLIITLVYSDSLSGNSDSENKSNRHARSLLADKSETAVDIQNFLPGVKIPTDIVTVKPESRSRSIVFLKTFKVGGTTISSLLTAYAFNTHQKIEKIDSYCRGRHFTKSGHCVDIIGTDHPKILPCNYPKIQAISFCNPAEVFMMIREPSERLWSGYKHEVKLAGEIFPLSRFLSSQTVVKRPSHHLLAKDVKTALRRTLDINVLLHHLYDESLVYMAMKTGMKLCDIMYVPCEQASWGATKCNTDTHIEMTESDKTDLLEEAKRTGEYDFYYALLSNAEERLKSEEIKQMTARYRKVRTKALKKCLEPGVVQAIEAMLSHHPYVKRDKGNERLWHYQVELSNPLDPLTICLGWYCSEK